MAQNRIVYAPYPQTGASHGVGGILDVIAAPFKAIAKVAAGPVKAIVKTVSGTPISFLVNPIDGIVHKAVGDKTYYAVAKAVGGDRVEAALRAGNHSIKDLSKGSTRAQLVDQGVRVAAVAVQEKLTPAQVKTVLASLPPESAQAARDVLAGKNPVAAPVPAPAPAPAPTPAKAPLRALDPPKRPAAPVPPPAAPAKAPLRALDPPKRPGASAKAPAPAQTAPATSAAQSIAASNYPPYPQMGTLSGPPPDCRALGALITDMPHGMHRAGLSAVNGSGGRSRMVHGPDGNDYLFELENGSLSARQCFP